MTSWEMDAGQLIFLGGPLMVPIVICSILSLGIIVEKLLFLSRMLAGTTRLKAEVFQKIRDNQIQPAVALCENNTSAVAKILKAGILKFGEERQSIKEAMEDASRIEVAKLERHLTALATIANISPLLGFLGTVAGLAACFHTIEVRAATLNPVTPGDLAGGIWEALLTTIAGMLVAIPTFVAYNYLVSRVNSIITDMEYHATELLNLLGRVSGAAIPAAENGTISE